MLMRDGAIRLGAYHWERLFQGMDALLLRMPDPIRQNLGAEVLRTAERNGHAGLGRIRLQVDAGNGAYSDNSGQDVGFVIETSALAPDILHLNDKGLILGVSDIVKHTGNLARLKTSSALPYALAARQAVTNCWDDALLTNEHGNLADSTTANIFWTERNKIYTPPLGDGCIAGVMRRHLLDVLPRIGYDASEKTLDPSILKDADSVFLSNAIRGIRWVEGINELRFSPFSEHISRNYLQYT